MNKLVAGFALFIVFFASAGKVEKGFENLKIYNYFAAKAQFEKAQKKHVSAASFGLATIYARTDNPFHNLDSAFVLILRSEKTFHLQSEKVQLKYKKYNFDYEQILLLRQKISTEFYKRTLQKPSELSFQHFLDQHPWAIEFPKATFQRDSVAFSQAELVNSSEAYLLFLQKYPKSSFFFNAEHAYFLKVYQEQTAEGTVSSLDRFLTNFPTNPYKGDAEDRIYELMTAKNTLANLESFLRTYPKNRNVDRAWRRLYQLFMYDYSDQRIDQFIDEYPDYPFKSELDQDRALASQHLLPFKQNGLFGWMNYKGEVVYPSTYESLGFFKEGLAIAAQNGQFGYVDKANKVVIPFQFDSGFDFEEGRAIVEKNNKFGIIDRAGKVLFEIRFEDIGQFSEGLIYGKKDSLYAYYDKYGMQRIPEQFDDAFSFVNGIALVEKGNRKGYVQPYGEYLIQPVFEELSVFNDSLFIFKSGDYYGIMHRNGKTVLTPTWDQIGALKSGKAIVVKGNKHGYIDDSARIVLNPTYDLFPNFMENAQFEGNYAKVKFKDKFGVIDAKGKWIIPATYSGLGNVSTLMAFQKGAKWGYIDLTNKVVIKPIYEFAASFEKGVAYVENKTLLGVINPKGEWLLPTEYEQITRLENNYYLVAKEGNLSLFSPKFEKITTNAYEQIRLVDATLFLLSNPQVVHYYDLKEQKLVVPNLKSESDGKR